MDSQAPETGALEGKVPYTSILTEFRIPLAAIGLVHRRGARKYAAYSWLRDPNASNSTVWENIDALVRHMTAHSIGLVRDIEGLPHIYHICCRAGMLVSTYLREQEKYPLDWPEKSGESTIGGPDPGSWLTPEEMVVLANCHKHTWVIDKVTDSEGNYDIAKLHNYLYSLLLTAAMSYETKQWTAPKEAIFGELSLPENIFIAALLYTKEYSKLHPYETLVDMSQLTDDDKMYCGLFMK